MAQAIESDILKILNDTRDAIRANMDARHINASGRTSASIRVEVYDGGFRLVGGQDTSHPVSDYPSVLGTLETGDTAPIPTLEVGREGGKVPRGFYYIIREWSRDKGLQFSSEAERGTFAYFVARKIARTGTHRHVQPEDVYSTPVETAKQRLNALFAASVQRTVRAALGGARVTNLSGAFTT